MQRVQIAASKKRVAAQIGDIKVRLARDVKRIIDTRDLSQQEVSYMTGEAASQISLVYTGKLRGFSTDRLLRLRAMLGAEIHIEICASTRPTITTKFC